MFSVAPSLINNLQQIKHNPITTPQTSTLSIVFTVYCSNTFTSIQHYFVPWSKLNVFHNIEMTIGYYKLPKGGCIHENCSA